MADPGAFADGINGVAKTFVIAGTLYAGAEMIGITAGESANPRRSVPRAIRQVFWRILIFYVGMMFFMYLKPITDTPGSILMDLQWNSPSLQRRPLVEGGSSSS